MYVKSFGLLILLFMITALVGCGNAIPQVDFLQSINVEKNIVKKPMSTNVSATQTVMGGTPTVKIKSRVSYIGLQQTFSNSNYKVKGKISY